ncbi:hypothetical protein [Streptomyces sp. NPDC047070]|uniref:hypothetical protein n=1 Tax=Streptomyces sp. NPDC047070 TaxID=3154923 RepID=UPI003451EF5E
MAGDMGVYGTIAAVAGTMGGVVIALINRDRGNLADPAAPQPGPERVVEEVDDPDLQTVEGIARMVMRQGRLIRQLQDADQLKQRRLDAMTRHVRVLEGTIRQLGGVVPDPPPQDAPLIDR